MSLSISCIDTLNHEKSLHAIKRTIETLSEKVHVDRVYWYSDLDIGHFIKRVPVTHYQLEEMYGQVDYSHVSLKICPKVCTQDFDIIVQWDGYAVNPEAWTNEFFNYDYIGATWDDGLVGNGGFSWRSRKLYDAMIASDIKSKYEQFDKSVVDTTTYHGYPSYAGEDKSGKFVPEDVIIARLYREQFEKQYGIKYAPYEIADRFSIENHSYISPWTGKPNEWVGKSLGFHGKHGILSLYNL
jgi:Protein of unknown function (DUF5672)